MHGAGPVAVVVTPPDVGMVVPVGVVGPGGGRDAVAVVPSGGHVAAAVEGARPGTGAVPTEVVVSPGAAARTAEALVDGLRPRELDVVLPLVEGTGGRANVLVVTTPPPAGTVTDVGAAGGGGALVCDVVAGGAVGGAVGGAADVTGVVGVIVGVITVGTVGRVNAVSGIDGKTLDVWTTVVGVGGRGTVSAAPRSTTACAIVIDDMRASSTARPAAYRRVTFDERRPRDAPRRGTRLRTNARRVLQKPAHRPGVMPESSRGAPESDVSCPPPTAS